MKILEHSESHIVKLDDGSTWQIFPGDINQTLSWMPTTELRLFEVNDEVASIRMTELMFECALRASVGRRRRLSTF
jgi:hypothetical protein